QDYNRFNTVPAFVDTSTVRQLINPALPSLWADLAPNGEFCDPQIGCSDRIATFDISQSSGKQFSQELRLQSDFGGPVNFSFGANYTKFETVVDYYVFSNLLPGIALTWPFYIPPATGID